MLNSIIAQLHSSETAIDILKHLHEKYWVEY